MQRNGLTVLFIHYDFPSQFRGLVAHYLARPGVRVAAIQQACASAPFEGVHYATYQVAGQPPAGTHAYARNLEAQVRRGAAVLEAAARLRAQGVVPDLIYVHPGWGEALFLEQAFPEAKRIVYCEFYYRMSGADVGFDPEFPAPPELGPVLAMQNTAVLHALNACHAAVSPTLWQKQGHPAHWRPLIEVIHEGIDTDLVRPDPSAALHLGPGLPVLRAGDEVVTFVSRDLEPYRGFHTFMRALPELLARRPGCRVLVVGKDGPGYGPNPPEGLTWRQKHLAENRIDLSRVHFLGAVPYNVYLKLLQVSACHIYLSYPFVLSWSCIEAMSAGCLMVGSATTPVMEAIEHGVNGLLTDFFDPSALASTVAAVLESPSRFAHLRAAARHTAVTRYDHSRVCLPAHLRMAQRVLEGR
ncbi:MAG: glycosyltransferase [Acidobacteriota bacterium]